MEKGQQDKKMKVGKVYQRNDINEYAQNIYIKKAGGRHPSYRKGTHFSITIEAKNGYFYTFIPYSGFPKEGRWKCVAGNNILEKII
jgi:hypothetical protein